MSQQEKLKEIISRGFAVTQQELKASRRFRNTAKKAKALGQYQPN